MSKKKNARSEIVLEYIRRFPDTPSLTIARKIYAENSEQFKDQNSVWYMVRYYRGLAGDKNRKQTIKMDTVVPIGKFKLNPFKLPKSYGRKRGIFNIPAKYDNILLISDLHIPFHDIPAITRAIEFGKEKKVNCIVINGDLLDFFQISRFVKLIHKRSVKQEIEAANQFLDILNHEFPDIPIFFLLGNHDIRLQTFLAVKAPELLDMNIWKLEELLFADKHNMTIISDLVTVYAGKLTITHGHLLLRGFFAPVNAARGAFLRSKDNVIISHVHKVSNHQETTIKGKTIATWSTGCLCELNPEYSPFANNYSHGFAWIRVLPNRDFKVSNFLILNGEIMT